MIRSRRVFLQSLGAIAGLATLGSATESCSDIEMPSGIKPGNNADHITVDVSSLDANGKVLVTSDVGPDGATIVVYRQADGVYVAHSMKCTHEGCLVGAPDRGLMRCPCHGAQFSNTGAVVRGPAEFRLFEYVVVFDSGTNMLTIKFK